MGLTDQGVGKRRRRCPDLGKDLNGGGKGSLAVWVRDVGDDTAHWEVFGRISPQGGPQADKTTTTEGGVWEVGVYHTDEDDGGSGITGGGDLRLPTPEHSLTVHRNKDHYGPVSGSGEASGVMGGQSAVGAGSLEIGGDGDGGSGGEMGGGVRGDGQDGNGYGDRDGQYGDRYV